MMAYTDRYCRWLHRVFSPHALLYTEMMTTGAILHGPRDLLLDNTGAAGNDVAGPVAIQLGGSEPDDLAQCAALAASRGYAEVNLNVGCPSPRVQRGAFGACLMREPERVAACVSAMRSVTDVPVTVKCRLGVDDDDSPEFLHRFVETVAAGGCETFIVHARKAFLHGLSPAQNRDIPPLQHQRVLALTSRYPELAFELNGGLRSVEPCLELRGRIQGVMIGRAALQNPWLIADLDTAIYGAPLRDRFAVVRQLVRGIEAHVASGGRARSITRHMHGLFAGVPGARRYRRLLGDVTTGDTMAGVRAALSAVGYPDANRSYAA